MSEFTLYPTPKKVATPIPNSLKYGLGQQNTTPPWNNNLSQAVGSLPPIDAKADESFIRRACEAISDFAKFEAQYWDPNNSCFRLAVNKQYLQILKNKQSAAPENEVKIFGKEIPILRKTRKDYNNPIANFDVNGFHPIASITVHSQGLNQAQVALETCLRQSDALLRAARSAKTNTGKNIIEPQGENPNREPFDKRLQRLMVNADDQTKDIMPLSTKHWEAATVGFVISETALQESLGKDNSDRQALLDKRKADVQQLVKDNYFIGVPALTNTYAIVKLYGSEGGEKIVNMRGDRRWYEIDMGNKSAYNFASVPSTTSLIDWGNGDPYGRTPYHFSDFVFSKYWNKIPNNRLITLRRYAAPILDNLKFPGMDGLTKTGTSTSDAGSKTKDAGVTDAGSSGKIIFPPMASAITYFGNETGNSLNKLIAFTTGLKWDDVQANVWEVNTESTPDLETGPGKLFGSLSKFAEMLNVAGGNYDPRAIQNEGNLPPDPYKDGPYENRIMGPLNRIDKVKKRTPGIEFTMNGLNITFEYVARPVGGVNPKAAILDIMSNFLIIGSASAVFFGGQHRFMGRPAKYPFIGGDKGIEQVYSGKSMEWAKSAMKDFAVKSQSAGSGLFESAAKFFDTLLSGGKDGGIFGAIEGLFTGGATGRLMDNVIAKKTSGQVPYLTGLRATLTGEPVGEWHVTIGNPLNPIAMIGNLICTGVDVDWNDELGPDDFPTEIKLTVHLEHGMARDRDAIQSMFNRGMGRIYDLPDNFLGSADYQTTVDAYTQVKTQTGTMPNARMGILATSGTYGRKTDKPVINEPKLHSNVSVWRGIDSNFLSISPNASTELHASNVFRSSYRATDWIAQKSLK